MGTTSELNEAKERLDTTQKLTQKIDAHQPNIKGIDKGRKLIRRLSISSYLALGLSMLVIAIGIHQSTATNWEPFGRSGSVLVMIGVALTYLDFLGYARNEEKEIASNLELSHAEFMNLISDNSRIEISDDNKKILEWYHQIIQKYLVTIIGAYQKRLSVMRLIEITTILLGTLIWGFGDLIPKTPLFFS